MVSAGICKPRQIQPWNRQAFAEMAVVHEAWVAELLRDLSGDEKNQLIRLFSKMRKHLHDD